MNEVEVLEKLKRDFWVEYKKMSEVNISSVVNGELIRSSDTGTFYGQDRIQVIFYGFEPEALLFDGVYGKSSENKVICRSINGIDGVLQVEPAEIPIGYKIASNRKCNDCFMGVVQRYKGKGYKCKVGFEGCEFNSNIPACGLHVYASGYVLDDNNNVDIIIFKLTSIASESLMRLKNKVNPDDEIMVSIEGDFLKKTAKFNFNIQPHAKNKLEPHHNLKQRFSASLQVKFNLYVQKIKEVEAYRDSIAPKFEVLQLSADSNQTGTDIAVPFDDNVAF